MMILKAEIQHLNDIVPLFEGYQQKSNPEAVKSYLKERLEKQDTVIFITYIGEQAVGFCQLFHRLSSVYMQPLFILNDLFIDRKFRKRGIGAALLEKAKILCERLHYKALVYKPKLLIPPSIYTSIGVGKKIRFALYLKIKFYIIQYHIIRLYAPFFLFVFFTPSFHKFVLDLG